MITVVGVITIIVLVGVLLSRITKPFRFNKGIAFLGSHLSTSVKFQTFWSDKEKNVSKLREGGPASSGLIVFSSATTWVTEVQHQSETLNSPTEQTRLDICQKIL